MSDANEIIELPAAAFTEQCDVERVQRPDASGPGGQAVRLGSSSAWIAHEVEVRAGWWRIRVRGAGFGYDQDALWMKLNHQRGASVLHSHRGHRIVFDIDREWDESRIDLLVDTPTLRLQLGPGKRGTVVDSVRLEPIPTPAKKPQPLPEIRAIDPHADRVIPQPQQMETAGDPLVLPEGLPLVLSPQSSARERQTARLLRDKLWDRCGIRLPIVERHDSDTPAVHLGLTSDPELADLGRPVHDRGEEAYALEVTPSGARIAGNGSAGLFHGTTTLLQLAHRGPDDGIAIPGVRIADWPALTFRGARVGLMGEEPIDLAYLKRLFEVLASFKANHVILTGLPQALRLDRYPDLAADQALTKEELAELVDHAESHFIKVGARISIAPIHWAPGKERYAHLIERAEDEEIPEGTRPNFCPQHPETRQILEDLIDEIEPLLNGDFTNTNIDEVHHIYDGGRWGVCPRCRDRDPAELFAEHVDHFRAYVEQRYGRRCIHSSTMYTREHGGEYQEMHRFAESASRDVAIDLWSDGVWRGQHPEAGPERTLHQELWQKGFERTIDLTGYDRFTVDRPEYFASRGKIATWGGTVTNYNAMDEATVAAAGHWLDYAFCFDQFWSPDSPPIFSAECLDRVRVGMERAKEIVRRVRVPSLERSEKQFAPVDLCPHFNRTAADPDGRGWLGLGPDLDLASLPTGETELAGIPFALAADHARPSCVLVSGPGGDPRLPIESGSIDIGQETRALYFLHAAGNEEAVEVVGDVGFYRIRYADGGTVETRLRRGLNIAPWIDSSLFPQIERQFGVQVGRNWHLYDARPGWLGHTRSGWRVILFIYEWINPEPQRKVAQVSLVPAPVPAKPALFALTALRAPREDIPEPEPRVFD